MKFLVETNSIENKAPTSIIPRVYSHSHPSFVPPVIESFDILSLHTFVSGNPHTPETLDTTSNNDGILS
jgi:hypothetical protein